MSVIASQAIPEQEPESTQLSTNYLGLRKAVGWIGSLLPIGLLAGNIFFTFSLPDSMSGYYYTPMRDLFVGTLCALGVFLICYAGYDAWDRWVTNISGLGMIGVAFCATKPTVCAASAKVCAAPAVPTLTTAAAIRGDVHLCFAAIAFLALGFMALRFTISNSTEDKPPRSFLDWIKIAFGFAPLSPEDLRTPAKKLRNVVYRVCGFSIFGCVILAVVSNAAPSSVTNVVPLLFIFEALATIAFGISWLVKGETMLLPKKLKG
jgi:hypothetical protein